MGRIFYLCNHSSSNYKGPTMKDHLFAIATITTATILIAGVSVILWSSTKLVEKRVIDLVVKECLK